MTISQTTNDVSQSLLDSVNGTRNTSASAAQAAQDRFMKLLVTQMQNQDPLNPMDNAQVTSQMAQLSTVTGIDKLNTSLETMMSNLQASQSLQASSLIGHQALITGNNISFDSATGSGAFGIDLPSSADNVTISITDSAGNQVHQMSIGKLNAGTFPLSWDGKDDAGNTVATGDYKFTVSATASGQNVSADALSLVRINSITSSTSGVKLNLSNDSTVATTDLKQIF
jgi:flagellar basal-body rod modification protein FlgD